MKKIFTFIATAMLLAAPALFTSCDEDPWYWYGDNEPWWYDYYDDGWGWDDSYYDDGGYYDGEEDQGNTALDEAEVLEGEWDGPMAYTHGDNGQVDNFSANITFVRNPGQNSIKGTGTEIDYYIDNDGKTVYAAPLKFDWYIDENNGDIYIQYVPGGSTFVMDLGASKYGFWLDEQSGKFQGFMVGTNNKDMIQFDFSRQTTNYAKKVTRATATNVGKRSFGTKNFMTLIKGTTKLNNRR